MSKEYNLMSEECNYLSKKNILPENSGIILQTSHYQVNIRRDRRRSLQQNIKCLIAV
jgi:hypothetical protein